MLLSQKWLLISVCTATKFAYRQNIGSILARFAANWLFPLIARISNVCFTRNREKTNKSQSGGNITNPSNGLLEARPARFVYFL